MAYRSKKVLSLLAGKRLTALEPKLERIARLKAEMELAQAELDALTDETVPLLVALGKTYILPDGIQFTAVQGHMTVYDEGEIRKAVGEEVWAQIRKESLDTKKTEALVTAGLIPIEVIASNSEIRPKKPYVLVTVPKSGANEATAS